MKERVGIIYEIICLETKRKYIGRSVYNEDYRFKQHVDKSKNPKSDCYNNLLQVAIRTYGVENFKVRVIARCIFREYYELNAIEQKYIHFFKTIYPFGYNVSGLRKEEYEKYRDEKGCD